jgi:hypothetical protein
MRVRLQRQLPIIAAHRPGGGSGEIELLDKSPQHDRDDLHQGLL